MKFLRIKSLLFLFLYAMSIVSYAQSDLRLITEEDKFFRPILVIPPQFPKEAAIDKLPVEIRVKGMVSEDGTLLSPEFSPLDGNEKFIEAIKDVLPLWRFRPAVDQTLCAPVASNGVLLVWFEAKDGSPSVSVSYPKRAVVSAATAANVAAAGRTFTRSPRIEFPFSARVAGMEGSAVLLIAVNYEGEIVQKRVLYSVPNKVFGDAALMGVKRALFNVIKPEADTPKTVCMTMPLKYCLSSGVNYPSGACK